MRYILSLLILTLPGIVAAHQLSQNKLALTMLLGHDCKPQATDRWAFLAPAFIPDDDQSSNNANGSRIYTTLAHATSDNRSTDNSNRHVASLIAVALDKRYGIRPPLSDITTKISSHVPTQSVTFMELKRVFQQYGVNATGYHYNAEEIFHLAPNDTRVAFIIDQTTTPGLHILALLFAADDHCQYLLYPSGLIIGVPTPVFTNHFIDERVLIPDEPSQVQPHVTPAATPTVEPPAIPHEH